MNIPVSEKSGCVWCHENPPCAKVGFSLVRKPMLEGNILLIFCRGVYAPLCLLWVTNRVTNPHLFKVKDRSLALVITNLFSVRPFSFEEFIGCWSTTKHIAVACFSFLPCDFPCCVADSAFSSTIRGALVPHQSDVLHSSMSVQRKLCPCCFIQVVCQVESCHFCRRKGSQKSFISFISCVCWVRTEVGSC